MKNLFKLSLLIFAFLGFSSHTKQSAPSNSCLFTVLKDDKSGYINSKGELIVSCIYDKIETYKLPTCSNGYISFKKNGAWGVMDLTGKVIIEAKYKNEVNFNEYGYAAVTIKEVGEDGDEDEDDWYAALDFGFDDKYIIIDKTGKKIMEKEYQTPVFSGGLNGQYFIYKLDDNTQGFINLKTKTECSKTFYTIKSFENGKAIAQTEKSGNYGVIDDKGNWIIQPKYYSINTIEDNNQYQVSDAGNSPVWKIIDNTGKVVAGPFGKYKRDFFFSYSKFSKEGLLVVQDTVTKLWGFMNQTGKIAIACKYTKVNSFYEGKAMVCEGGKVEQGYFGTINIIGGNWKCINTTGSVLFSLADLDDAGNFSEGRCSVQTEELWGFIDASGKYIVNPKFKKAPGYFTNGLSKIEKDDAIGYIDINGKYVWEPSK